jgi:hypothetical protein
MIHQVIEGTHSHGVHISILVRFPLSVVQLDNPFWLESEQGLRREKQTAIAALDTTEAAGLKAGQFRFRGALREDHWPTKIAQHGACRRQCPKYNTRENGKSRHRTRKCRHESTSQMFNFRGCNRMGASHALNSGHRNSSSFADEHRRG